MKMKKLVVLIIGIMFFLNLHAALITHLKFEEDLEDSYGNNNGTNHGVSYTTGREGRGIYFNDADEDYLEVGEIILIREVLQVFQFHYGLTQVLPIQTTIVT